MEAREEEFRSVKPEPRRVSRPRGSTSGVVAATSITTIVADTGPALTFSDILAQIDEKSKRRLEKMHRKLRRLEMQMEVLEAEMNKANQASKWN